MWWILYQVLFSKVFLILFAVAVVYHYGVRTYNYWKKKDIPYIQPKYPYLGNLYEASFSFKFLHIKQQEIYKYFHGKRFGGIYFFTKPTLFLRDPKLIETVLIKDFTSFYNRESAPDTELDPLSAHLFSLTDEKWKNLRNKLTPTFSSGKLKLMHQQLTDCADNLLNYTERYAEKCEPFEAREVLSKFSTDVIGSCAFGLNINAVNDPNSEFRKMGDKVFSSSFLTKLRRAIKRSYPELLTLLKWRAMDKSTEHFFISMIKSTIAHRESNNVVRNDFVQLLMELRKQEEVKQASGQLENNDIIIDEKTIAANAFVFFVAGFETTASTLSYCLYQLSLNQDVQEEAYQQMLSILKKHGGEISYDAVNEMTLIDQIISETLRMHPPVPELRRTATKNYAIRDSTLVIPKGSLVIIPAYSLHYDSEHFPEPEKFKPQRFNKETNVIRKGTYLPFGDGPRICIGKRFARMEMQLALVKLLLKYKFTLNSRTISPLYYDPAAVFLTPIGGIWVDLHKR